MSKATGATAAPASGADPMLTGTYHQDERKDFPDSSAQLDDFERRLASGTAAHSPHHKASGAPAAHAHTANASAGQQKSGPHPPPMRGSFAQASAPNHKPRTAHRRLSEEEQTDGMEKAEEVREVRALGHARGDADDSD